MENDKGKEFMSIQMEINIKENLIMIKNMDLENIFKKIKDFMKESLNMVKNVVKAFINLKMEINMMVFGKKINVMDKVNLLGTQEKLMKENGITI